MKWSRCYKKNSDAVSFWWLDYKVPILLWQWREPSSSSNPQSDISSKEHLKIWLTISFTIPNHPPVVVEVLQLQKPFEDHVHVHIPYHKTLFLLLDKEYRRTHTVIQLQFLEIYTFITKDLSCLATHYRFYTSQTLQDSNSIYITSGHTLDKEYEDHLEHEDFVEYCYNTVFDLILVNKNLCLGKHEEKWTERFE